MITFEAHRVNATARITTACQRANSGALKAVQARKDRGGRLGPSVMKLTTEDEAASSGAGETAAGETAATDETSTAGLQQAAQALQVIFADLSNPSTLDTTCAVSASAT